MESPVYLYACFMVTMTGANAPSRNLATWWYHLVFLIWCNTSACSFVKSTALVPRGVTALEASEATRRLFDAHADAVYRYACYVLRDSTEAEDAVQEIFIKVLRSWDQFQGQSNTKTWLWSITRNHLYDRLRKKKLDHRLLRQQMSVALLNAASAPLPDDHEIQELLMGLKLSYRQVLVLRYMQDLTTEEIAASLGWSHVKVRTTLHRAIKELRKRTQQSEPQRHVQWKAGESLET